MKLTIGMATFDDFDGVYFSLQALRVYHADVLQDAELIVIDNKPNGCRHTAKAANDAKARYVKMTKPGTAAPRQHLFDIAQGEIVCCMDSHVLIAPGGLNTLLAYFKDRPACKDIVQGPLRYDQGHLDSHFDPVWRAGMYGVWAKTPVA